MDVMANTNTAGRNGAAVAGKSLKRLELEMALKVGEATGRSPADKLRKAAAIVGGDLLFVLPAKDAPGTTGVIRLQEDGDDRFIQVRIDDSAFAIAEEPEIDADYLGFARASLNVLERLRADWPAQDSVLSAAH